MKILILGSSGQMGRQFSCLRNSLESSNTYLCSKSELDISSAKSVDSFFIKNSFDVVINCAAYTKVDKAEENYNYANLINGFSIGYICKSLEEYKPDTKLIHLSTDYIFDGNASEPIKETDIPNPISKYGMSKLLGEEIIQKSYLPSITIRLSWLYSIYGNNFMKTIIKLSQTNNSINVINDQIGSPTSANDLAKCIFKVIHSKKFDHFAQKKSIFNFCNRGSCSWYEFAKEILLLTGSDCKVFPISTEEYNALASRPKYSVLNTSKIENSFDLKIASWEVALKETINSLNTNL